jgi:hypothetical protein
MAEQMRRSDRGERSRVKQRSRRSSDRKLRRKGVKEQAEAETEEENRKRRGTGRKGEEEQETQEK